MDNNNNLKEEYEFDSGDEAKRINPAISDEQNEKLLDYADPAVINVNDVKRFFEERYPQLKIYNDDYNNPEQSYTHEKLKEELKNQTTKILINSQSQSAAEKFKAATTSNTNKYISRAKKAPSQASFDKIKIEENGMENDGQ